MLSLPGARICFFAAASARCKHLNLKGRRYACYHDGPRPRGKPSRGAGYANAGCHGLGVSDAVRVLLMRVVTEQKMPFALETPIAETRAAMAEADEPVRPACYCISSLITFTGALP